MREADTPVWDAIVVGAGPAGCAAAYDLATGGRSVLLLDRAEFPRAKACAGGLTQTALQALRYSVEPVTRLHCTRIVLEDGAGRPVEVSRPSIACVMTVREELDAFCLAKTMERGAIFRRIHAGLQALAADGDGVALTLSDGEVLRAKYLVGADGVHSRVRGLLGPSPWFRRGFALEANVPYREGERYPLLFDFAAAANGYGWLFPRDNHVNVGLGVFAAAGGKGERLDRAVLDRYIAERCGEGREVSQPVGQFLGMGGEDYVPPPDTRVLLAGDAGGFVNTLTGEGLSGAILSGQAAAMAVHAALGGSADALPSDGKTRPVPAGTPAGTGFLVAAGWIGRELRVGESRARHFYPDIATVFRLLRFPVLSRMVLEGHGGGVGLDLLSRAVRRGRRMLGCA